MAHVIVGLGVLIAVFAWSLAGRFTLRRHMHVTISSAYWHFVDVVWLCRVHDILCGAVSRMSEAPPLEARIEHPAPERSQVGLARLLTGLCAAPCAWVLQLLAMYALASNACTPTAGRHGQQINAGFPGEVAALIGLNLLFFALAVAGGLLSVAQRREGEARGTR